MISTSTREITLDGSQTISEEHFCNNALKESRYSLQSIILLSISRHLKQLSSIYFIILILIECFYTQFWNLMVFLLILVAKIVQDLIKERPIQKIYKCLNLKTFRIWNGSEFIEISSKHISVGNILLMQGYIPADVIILASLDKRVSVKSCADEVEFKAAPEELEKFVNFGSVQSNLARLIGTVIVEEANSEFRQFNGKLKLRGKPSYIKLDANNIIYQGSHVDTQIIGLVVYTGKDSKLMQNSKATTKFSALNSRLEILAFYSIAALIILLICSIIAFLSISPDSGFLEILVQFILLYSPIVHLSTFASIEIIRIISLFSFKRTFKSLQISDSTCLENIGNAEFVLIDDKSLIYRTQAQKYSYGHELLDIPSVQRESEVFTLITERNESMSFMKQDTSSQFWLNLIISTSVSRSNKKYIGLKDEIAMVTAAEELGFIVARKEEKVCEIEYEGKMNAFEVIGSSKLKGINRVIFSRGDYGGIVLMGQMGDLEALFGEMVTKFEEHETEFIEQGMRAFSLFYRSLNIGEIDRVREKLKRSQGLMGNKISAAHAFEKLTKDLQFLGTIGVRSCIDNSDKEAIQSLRTLNVKTIIASAGNKFKVRSLAQSMGLPQLISLEGLESETLCYRTLSRIFIDFLYKVPEKPSENRPDTLSSMEPCIEQQIYRYSRSEKTVVNHRLFRKLTIRPKVDLLQHAYPWPKSFTLLLDQTTFKLCLKNKSTKELLICLLSVSPCTIIYNFLPNDQILLVKLLRTHITHHPGVISLTHNKWGLGALRSSTVGLSNNKKILCDISNMEIELLPKIIKKCRKTKKKAEFIAVWGYFKNFYCVMVFFWYQAYSQFSAIPIFNRQTFILFNLVTGFQIFTRRKLRKASILRFAILALVESALVVLTLFCTGNVALLVDGMSQDYEDLGYLVFTVVSLSVVIQGILEMRSVTLGVLAIGVLIAIVSQQPNQHLSTSSYYWIQLTFTSLFISVPGIIAYCFHLSKAKNPPKFFKYDSFSQVYKAKNSYVTNKDSLATDKYTLKFLVSHIEAEYNKSFIQESLILFKSSLSIVLIILTAWGIYNTALTQNLLSILIRSGTILFMLCLLLFSFTKHFKTYYHNYILLTLAIAIAFKFFIEILVSEISIISILLIPSVSYVLLNVNWVVTTYLNLVSLTLSIITIVSYSNYSALSILYSISLLLLFYLSLGTTSYSLERYYRNVFKITQELKIQVERTQSTLEILLPDFVIPRVKSGIRYIAEDQGEVTVIFCDICELEEIYKMLTPQEFIATLDSVFLAFDVLCEEFGVMKVETVSKTYMACAGLGKNLARQDYARIALDLALQMTAEVKKLKVKGKGLKVKIGINTGQVTAGVVGYHKPQFSLVGDTVNTASRMCSTLKSYNSVQISMETYKALSDISGLVFLPNTIFAKGKGEMSTFIIKKKKNFEIIKAPSLIAIQSQRISNWRESVMQREDTGIIESIWDFKIAETTIQQNYREKKCKTIYAPSYLSLEFSAGIYGILNVLEIVSIVKYEHWIAGVLMKSFSLLLFLILFICHSRFYLSKSYMLLQLCLVASLLISSQLTLHSWPELISILECSFTFQYLNSFIPLNPLHLLLLDVFFLFFWLLCAALTSTLSLSSMILLFFLVIVSLTYVYRSEQKYKVSYNLEIHSAKEISETEALLTQLMPAHIVENLSEGQSISEKIQDVTILYADIVGFTAWSSGRSSKEVVKMLSNLFTKFDRKCVELQVYKVHTIGDCYVVIGYLAGRREPEVECLNVVKLAQEMIRIIDQENRESNAQLAMRIGIHTGEVVAGVIGSKVVRYDIWGNDVMIANKMESNGKSGEINLSEVTKRVLEEKFQGMFEFKFNTEIGEGIKIYFVDECKSNKD